MVFSVLCQFPTWAERVVGGFLIAGRLCVNLGSGSQPLGNIFALQVGPQGWMCSWAFLWTVCLRKQHPTYQVGGALLAPSRHWWFLVNLQLMSNTLILRENDICYYVIQSTLVNYHIFSWYIASIFRTFRKDVMSLKLCLGKVIG